jgi:type VI secretion system secreted protein VgrG
MPHPVSLISPLPPEALRLHSMTATEGLSTLGELQLGLLSDNPDLLPEDLLGHPMTAVLELRDGHKRHFHGLVTRFGSGAPQGRHFGYRASLRPWLWFLTRTSDCRIFQDMTVPDIVKTVFSDHAAIAKFEFKLFRQYRTRVYCVQYRETDHNFVARLLEEEGIYWYFEHSEQEHKLMLVDDMGAHNPVAGYETLPYYGNRSQVPPDTEYVSSWSFSREVKAGSVVLRSYDFERPSTSLTATNTLAREYALSEYEQFDYQPDFLTNDDGLQLAENRVGEQHSHFERLRGASNAQGLTVGHLFDDRAPPARRPEHRVPVRDSRRSARAGQRLRGRQRGVGIRLQLHGDPGDRQQFRPTRRTPKPFVQGPQTAVVVGPAGEEIFTDKYGRVKVQFHWDRYGQKNESSSCWLRVSSPWAGKSFGFIQVPRIGQEVVVDFLEGDPDQPLVTGRVYNAEQMPPWELPANATQSGVLTRSSKGGGVRQCQRAALRGQEGRRAGLMIHAEKNMDTSVENDESRSIGHDQITTVNNHQTVVVEKGREVYVNLEGEKYYVKGPRNCYYDGKQVQVVTNGYDTFVTGERGEYTTGERKVFTTAAYSFKSTNAFFDVGPQYLVTGGAFGFIASKDMFLEATGDHNSKAANFKFTSMGNFNFTGNQFNRTIFEGNDTVLGPNTNTYIGVSRDTAVGSASQTFIGTQNSVTTGMSIDGYLGIQISNFLGLALSNAVAVSMDNAAINLGMTAVDLTVNGISLDNNAIKLLNAGGAGGPGAAAAFSAGPGIAAACWPRLFGLGFGLARSAAR